MSADLLRKSDRDQGRKNLERLALHVTSRGAHAQVRPDRPLNFLRWTGEDGRSWSATWVAGGRIALETFVPYQDALALVDRRPTFNRVADLLRALANETDWYRWDCGDLVRKMRDVADQIDVEHERRMEQQRMSLRKRNRRRRNGRTD